MMMLGQKDKQRGVALLLVLITIVILGAMTADLMESNEVYLTTAVNHRESVKAEYLAKSAVNMSRLLLSLQQVPPFSSELNFPFWLFADMMFDPFTATESEGGMLADLAGISFSTVQGLGLLDGQDFSVKIVDEESKINVNMLARPQEEISNMVLRNLAALVEPEIYDELFDKGDFRTAVTREQLICEIKDFADQDEDSCLGVGGEEPYYTRTDPPYERKNAPYDSLMELFMVHGLGDDFWATFVEPDAQDPGTRILTVWGEGKINVNTASAGALVASLCQLAADDAGISPCSNYLSLANLSRLIQLFLTDVSLFPVSNVSDFASRITDPSLIITAVLTGQDQEVVGFPIPTDQNRLNQIFTTSSKVFSIYATGTSHNSTKRIHAVVDVTPRQPDILDPSQSLTSAGGKILYWRLE